MDQLIILIVLLFFSAFFSSSEMAYIVSNKLKIEVKSRKNNLAAKSAYFFVKDSQTFFSAILIGNNIVNIAFASFSAVFLASAFGLKDYQILIVSTVIMLLLGELIPKYLARESANLLLLAAAVPLKIFTFIIYPFVKVLSGITRRLTEKRREEAHLMSHLFDKEDLKILVQEGHIAGKVKREESNIISKVLDFGEQRVYEAMRPRTEISGVEIDSSIEEALDQFIETGFSKLIVYEENLDNIKGLILAKDIFNNPKDIRSITRGIKFYPETKKSLEILNEFLNSNTSIAAVVDEFGGTAGIVTVEDIIEELFGEIKDEYDVEENICRRVAKDEYIISGRVEIDLINEKYNLNLPEGDYETIAGFIVNELGRIPKQGETIQLSLFRFLIIRSDKKRIELLKLFYSPDAEITPAV